jgi:hypothetical protein
VGYFGTIASKVDDAGFKYKPSNKSLEVWDPSIEGLEASCSETLVTSVLPLQLLLTIMQLRSTAKCTAIIMLHPLHPSSTAVKLVTPQVSASCEPAEFLAPLKPGLNFEATGPGLMLGAANASVERATGAVTWSQAAGTFVRQQPALLLPVSVVVGSANLGQAAELQVQL